MKEIRAVFLKCLIDAEMHFEYLTDEEKINIIMKLIEDVNQEHPEYRLQLIRVLNSDESSINW